MEWIGRGACLLLGVADDADQIKMIKSHQISELCPPGTSRPEYMLQELVEDLGAQVPELPRAHQQIVGYGIHRSRENCSRPSAASTLRAYSA